MRILGYLLSVLSLAVLLCYTSCYYEDPEPIQAGLKTKVEGVVYDVAGFRAVPNHKVYLYAQRSPEGKNVDSVYTDQNGKYSITFKTDGKTYEYYMVPDERGYLTSNRYGDLEYGAENTLDINIAKATVLKSTVHIRENLHPPLTYVLASQYMEEGYPKVVALGRNKGDYDTTVYFVLKSNFKHGFRFRIDITEPDSTYSRQVLDTVNLESIFSDTVTREYTFKPMEFPVLIR